MLLVSRAHLRKSAVALGSRHRFAYQVRGSEPPARPYTLPTPSQIGIFTIG